MQFVKNANRDFSSLKLSTIFFHSTHRLKPHTHIVEVGSPMRANYMKKCKLKMNECGIWGVREDETRC